MSEPMDMPTNARQLAIDDRSFFGHPRGLSTLFFTEMWERFSFYGLRPLLVLFMSAAILDGGVNIDRDQASAIVGDLYPEGGARRDAGFSIFYMGINTGAFLGNIVTGFLGEKVGWHFGFGAAGVGMLIGLAWFASRAKKTLGDLGTEPSRNPDPVKQARQELIIKLSLGLGLAALAVVIVLASLGTIHLDPQVIGKNMTYVLVGVAVIYFALIFLGGGR